MAMSRSLGGTLLTTRPPIAISPRLISSSPAIMRSRVDLPQPDGPTSTTNSPSPMSISTPYRTWVEPKNLSTLPMSTDAMVDAHPVRVVAPSPYRAVRAARLALAPFGARPVDPICGDHGASWSIHQAHAFTP